MPKGKRSLCCSSSGIELSTHFCVLNINMYVCVHVHVFMSMHVCVHVCLSLCVCWRAWGRIHSQQMNQLTVYHKMGCTPAQLCLTEQERLSWDTYVVRCIKCLQWGFSLWSATLL